MWGALLVVFGAFVGAVASSVGSYVVSREGYRRDRRGEILDMLPDLRHVALQKNPTLALLPSRSAAVKRKAAAASPADFEHADAIEQISRAMWSDYVTSGAVQAGRRSRDRETDDPLLLLHYEYEVRRGEGYDAVVQAVVEYEAWLVWKLTRRWRPWRASWWRERHAAPSAKFKRANSPHSASATSS